MTVYQLFKSYLAYNSISTPYLAYNGISTTYMLICLRRCINSLSVICLKTVIQLLVNDLANNGISTPKLFCL